MRTMVAVSLVALLVIAACGGSDDDEGGAAPTVAANPGEEGACVPDAKQYDQAPEVTIDPAKTYVATIDTSKGSIVVELDASLTVTTNNFVFLAREGFYDCLTFHRVEPGFVIQGGDPDGNGTGGPGYQIPGEFGGVPFETGVLGMARSQSPDSAGSQFFIMLGRAEHLDGGYASFGRVTEGQDVAGSIAIGDTINTITIEER